MKKSRKLVLLLTTTVLMLTSCVVFASASSYSLSSFSFYTSAETANYSFDARPANKIRFIVTPRCSVAGAQVDYRLHTNWHNEKPLKQTSGVGSQIRAWWYADTGTYHVDLYAYNNKTNASQYASVSMNSVWFENYE